MKRKYESEMLQVIHEDMMDMHKSGIISDKRMREFDKMCLIQEPKTTGNAVAPARTRHVGRISAKGSGV